MPPYCRNCGQDLPGNPRICPQCGQDQTAPTSPEGPQQEQIPIPDTPNVPPAPPPSAQRGSDGWRRGAKMVGGGCLVLVLPFIFLAILLVIGIAFFGDPQSRNQPSQVEEETNEQKRATPKIKTAATARGVEVGVGETAELRDRTLVVDEVERNYPPPRRASKLKADEEFLRVFVTLTNTS